MPNRIQYSINDKGLALLQSFEGLRLTPYRDERGVLTCGWGHTGPDVHEGEVATKLQAEAWLREDVRMAEAAVSRLVTHPLTSDQASALICLVFNIGIGAFASSTLRRLVNAGDFTGAACQFSEWNRCAGEVDPGLTRRRAAERALFLAA